MLVRIVLALCLALGLSACGSGGTDAASSASLEQRLASLPVTLEGDLIAGEGDEYDPALASLPAAGSLVVNEDDDPVDLLIDRAMLKAAALPDDSGRVRVTLGEKVVQNGFAQYRVTKLEKL